MNSVRTFSDSDRNRGLFIGDLLPPLAADIRGKGYRVTVFGTMAAICSFKKAPVYLVSERGSLQVRDEVDLLDQLYLRVIGPGEYNKKVSTLDKMGAAAREIKDQAEYGRLKKKYEGNQ